MAKKKPKAPKIVKFKCPDCGHERAECRENNADFSSVITRMCPDGDMEYGPPVINDSDVEGYGCVMCNFFAEDGNGDPITDCEEFAKWCLKNCPQGD